MRKTIPLLLILIFLLSGCLPEKSNTKPVETESSATNSPIHYPPNGKTPSSSGKHALLIGIEKYNHPKITNLGGAINDVNLIQGVLRTRFGFQDDDFIILLDEQATHTGIENAFKTLIQRVQPKEFVYIHYSGHGSQTPDLNGDERSGKDQTWVSYGTRQPGRENEKDNYEVLDDEINAWLDKIHAKTDQVIFVSDSCHSATVARGNAPVSRGLELDEREHPLGRMAYTQIEEYQGIHIGSARDKEFAAETLGDDGKFYGLFTWHWAKALQQAQLEDTWNEVFKRAQTPVVGKRGEAQRPQLEGERHRQVFGGRFSPPVATVPVISVEGENIKIQAGATAGVTVGSIYRLHPKKSARLKITKVGTFESKGKIIVTVAAAVGAFKVGDLVVEESHAYHFDPTKVYLSADYSKDKPMLQAIGAVFQGTSELPSYVLTNKLEQADLRLQLLRPKRGRGRGGRGRGGRGRDGQTIYEKDSDNDALPKSFPNQSPELWILTPDQHLLHKKLQINFDDLNKGLKLLKYNLNQLARVRAIKALKSSSNRGSTLPVTVQMEILTPVKACPIGGNCMQLHHLGLHEKKEISRWQEIGQHRLNKGDILTFTLHNTSRRRDYYCYLISINPEGAIEAIYPDPEEGMEYARIKAGEKRELIDEVVLNLKNVGEQTLKLIATTKPMDVSLLQKEGFKGRSEADFNLLNPLERLLVSAVHGARARVLRMSNDEWFTEQVTFEIK